MMNLRFSCYAPRAEGRVIAFGRSLMLAAATAVLLVPGASLSGWAQDGAAVGGYENTDLPGGGDLPGASDGALPSQADDPASPIADDPASGGVDPEEPGTDMFVPNSADGSVTNDPPNQPMIDADTRAVPVVVELFTAQGCSTCPPADAMLAALAARRDVLALAWHVDYWDYLGWQDIFARPEHTLRQEAYAAASRTPGVYTPQFVVDGEETLATLRPAALMSMIQRHAARAPAITVTATRLGNQRYIELTPQTRIPGGVTVLLVQYAPSRQVKVIAGENRGETLTYTNVVLGSQVLAQWPATGALRLVIPARDMNSTMPPDTRHALIMQQSLRGMVALPGPILAAATLD